MSKNQAEICKTFFKLLESENDTWLCKCGRKLKQRKGTGWSNLYAHIKVQHQQKSETVANDLPEVRSLEGHHQEFARSICTPIRWLDSS